MGKKKPTNFKAGGASAAIGKMDGRMIHGIDQGFPSAVDPYRKWKGKAGPTKDTDPKVRHKS